MSGKTCLVTGATSGIGKETARQLAALGARVIIVARNEERGAAAAADIRASVPSAELELMTADLSSLDQVRRLADDVQARHDRLDVLMNNAGVISLRRQTADGLEITFAINHLAPFLLTGLLRDLLKRSAPARVVTVASAAHSGIRTIPWDNLATGEHIRQGDLYGLSKLLNILFTSELARRLEGTGVTANCLHPGFIRTSIGRDVTGPEGVGLRLLLRMCPGPATGAKTPVFLASSPEVAEASGGYYIRSKLAEPSALARDASAAARLWTLSAGLTGLDPNQ
jgi:NAD(P)-dependent dehydrogenase (short-subunit alcohol dehydrogenase family)